MGVVVSVRDSEDAEQLISFTASFYLCLSRTGHSEGKAAPVAILSLLPRQVLPRPHNSFPTPSRGWPGTAALTDVNLYTRILAAGRPR